jgi:hypothetical protein
VTLPLRGAASLVIRAFEDIYGYLELRFEALSDLGGAEIGKENIAGHSVSAAVGKEAAVQSLPQSAASFFGVIPRPRFRFQR